MTLLVFVSICLIWGFSWVAIKLSLEGIPPFLGAGLRFLIAVPLLYLYLRAREIPVLVPRQVYGMVMITAGLIYGIDYGLVYWSEQHLSAVTLATMIYILPVVAVVCEWLLYGELITLSTIAGMLLIFLGIAIAELPKYRSQLAKRA